MVLRTHRPALAAASIVLSALFVLVTRLNASAQPAPNPIVSVALGYEGTLQGQCWPFVRKVVYEATGRTIGWDYRQGFFEAGAIQVAQADAQPGDIIQVADDADTSPGASYGGLHTSIVLKNHGGGVFTVVDSNSQWDEVVRIRPNYRPGGAAAYYGNPRLTYHVYRIPVTGAAPAPKQGPAVVPPPTLSTAFSPGDVAIVKADGDGLNLRAGPGLDQRRILVIPDETRVTVLSAPVVATGLRWVQVTSPYGDGWVAAAYLQLAPQESPRAAGAGLPYRTFGAQAASEP